MPTSNPVVKLRCCCCGAGTKGRQWHNRDTGYGLCNQCVDFVSTRESPEDMLSNYGVKGTHYLVSMEYSELKEAAEKVQSRKELTKLVEKADELFLANILKMSDANWEEFTALVYAIHPKLSS